MTESALDQLASEHAPLVIFHPDEKYPPLDPEVFIKGAERRWRGSGGADTHVTGGVLGPIEPAGLGSGSEVVSPGSDGFRPVDLTRPYDARKTANSNSLMVPK
jgi:hypothetical protein